VAGTSLLALIDDIASLLDDVSALTKVATKKTAGVLGDDLALNAQQVTGVAASRELPVVWAVARGSLVNKAILVPAALAIAALLPWAITPLLMIGGAFLCYEGFEKLAHRFLHGAGAGTARQAELAAAVANPAVDLVAHERERIKGAVRTDFILSAEIIAITLGTVAGRDFPTQLGVLVGIAGLMTVGVYGLVAAIVKLDDAGLWLSRQAGPQRALGRGLLAFAPLMMKTLSVLGTAAMFLVGGGILSHGLPGVHGFIERASHALGALPRFGFVAEVMTPLVLDAVTGLVAGALCVGVVSLLRRLRTGRTMA
jgi:predicted DNA repair protein MutK